MKPPASLFHYTVGPKLPLIEASGELKPIGFSRATNPNERPVLWLSAHPTWEPTATKPYSLDGRTFIYPDLPDAHQRFGLFRFRLDCRSTKALTEAGVRLLAWPQIPTAARIDPKEAQGMIRSGLHQGAVPMHWWGCLSSISLDLMDSGLLVLESVQLDDQGAFWSPIEGGRSGLAQLAQGLAQSSRRIVQVKGFSPVAGDV